MNKGFKIIIWISVGALIILLELLCYVSDRHDERISELERQAKVLSANIDPMYQEWKNKADTHRCDIKWKYLQGNKYEVTVCIRDVKR
jgi:hypothetical protein